MARDSFAACLSEVLAHEGGYVDHPKDPGGATNMGITQATLSDWRDRPVSSFEVRTLTRAEAAAIYRARYWDAIRGDELPAGLDLVAFDAGVNSGIRRGVYWLQRALGVGADGRVGPVTLTAARAADPVPAIRRACEYRMGFLRRLGTWTSFGKGWSVRVARIEAVAVRMALAARGTPAVPVLLQAKAAAERQVGLAAARAGGVAAGGGMTATLADLPVWGSVAFGLGLVATVIHQLGRRRHEEARAAAFRTAAEEVRT